MAPAANTVPLAAELALHPAFGPVSRRLRGRVWLWRTLLGLVPTAEMLRAQERA